MAPGRTGPTGYTRPRNAPGSEVGDINQAYDGRMNLRQEGDAFYHGVNELKAGADIDVLLLRNDRKMTLRLSMQK